MLITDAVVHRTQKRLFTSFLQVQDDERELKLFQQGFRGIIVVVFEKVFLKVGPVLCMHGKRQITGEPEARDEKRANMYRMDSMI
jgi:hypothetical protein